MRFRAWRVVGRSCVVWWRNLPLLLSLTAIVSLPRIAWSIYRLIVPWRGSALEGEPNEIRFWWGWVFSSRFALSVLNLVLLQFTIAVVVLAVYRTVRGEEARVVESLRGGLRRWCPVTVVALAVTGIEVIVVVVMMWVIWRWWRVLNIKVMMHGAMLVCLMSLAPVSVAVPAAVVESGGNHLLRSWRLTRGRLLHVLLVIAFIYAVVAASDAARISVQADASLATRTALYWTIQLLLISWVSVVAAVAYHALRLDKEGVDVTELDGIFA